LPVSAGQSHLRFAPGADTAAILRTLNEWLGKTARQVKAKCIVFKEFDTPEGVPLELLAELGYQRADSLPMNHAEPNFESFEDFLAHLKSSKRYTIRRSQKKFAKSGFRVVQMTGRNGVDQIYTDDVHKLYEAVLEKATVKFEKLPPAFFRELARQLPDESAYTFIYDGDRIVAFACSLFTTGVYHQMFVGVNYELNPQWDLYFNVFYNAVDYAYRQHVSDIYVGQSADTFKQRKLGCHPVPLFFYIKGVDWLTALIMRKAFHLLFPSRAAGSAEPEGGDESEQE
jgi:predicted N-acyltransferase